ncbi:MAG: hypothetical protein GX951_03370 [Mollicutes bacterium]|nr:hypothetical protein [Mollicutes bacterium]
MQVTNYQKEEMRIFSSRMLKNIDDARKAHKLISDEVNKVKANWVDNDQEAMRVLNNFLSMYTSLSKQMDELSAMAEKFGKRSDIQADNYKQAEENINRFMNV